MCWGHADASLRLMDRSLGHHCCAHLHSRETDPRCFGCISTGLIIVKGLNIVNWPYHCEGPPKKPLFVTLALNRLLLYFLKITKLFLLLSKFKGLPW